MADPGESPVRNTELWNKLSANFLRLSGDSMKNCDVELTRDLRFAAHLSDTAAMAPPKWAGAKFTKYEKTDHQLSDTIATKLVVCQYISDILREFPAITDSLDLVVLHYHTRTVNLLKMQQMLPVLKRELSSLSSPADPRLLSLHEWQHDLLVRSIDELQHSCTDPGEIVKLQTARDSRLQQIAHLRPLLDGLLAALEDCGHLVGEVSAREASSVREKYNSLCDERDQLLSELTVTCHDESPNTSAAPVPCTMELLLRTAGEILPRAQGFQKELVHTVRVAKLVAFYRAEATSAARGRPPSQYRQKVAECWELAALAVLEGSDERVTSDARHCKFAALAEGVLASAVTCHTQWERAVQRRDDDKLADFWLRARERAWAVGCEIFDTLQNGGWVLLAKAQRIVSGV
jgi:hypothetical protein